LVNCTDVLLDQILRRSKMNRFENITKPLMWFMALLLTAFVAGCGGSSSGSPAPISAKAITFYSLKWIGGASGTLGATPGTATGTINETLKTIAVSVPFGTDVTTMKATFTSTGASVQVAGVTQTSNITVNDFTGSVAYKVTAVDSTWATYTVIVTPIRVTSIAVTPTSFSIPAGATHQFMATATYSNSTTSDVTTNNATTNATTNWTPDISGNATVGLHTGLAVGVTTSTTPVVITATFGGQSGTAALTVNPAILTSIAVTPATGATTTVGGTQQFVATGTYTDGPHLVTATASWTSAVSGVASVGSFDTIGTPGLATGLAVGTSDITATLSGQSAAAALTVTAATGPAAVDLLSILTNKFVILAETAITDVTPSPITGNIGVSAGTGAGIAVPCTDMLTGKVYDVDGTYAAGAATCAMYGPGANKTIVDKAVADMSIAYGDAKGRTVPAPVTGLGSGDISGMTLNPGIYKWSTGVLINTGASSGDVLGVTLDCLGDANAVFIFQIAQNLVVGPGAKVTPTGSCLAQNIFWEVDGSTGATLGTTSVFNGIILSAKQVILQSGAVLHGRALAQTQVVLGTSTVGP
jgi:hypothetical protein